MAYVSKYTGKQFDEAVGKVGTLETTVETKANSSDLNALQTEVGKKESVSNKVTDITTESTDTQYPSAKAVQARVTAAVAGVEQKVAGLELLVTSQTDLIRAKEDTSNKVRTLASTATDTQYPSAKAVYTKTSEIETTLATKADASVVETLSESVDYIEKNAELTSNKVTEITGNQSEAATANVNYPTVGAVTKYVGKLISSADDDVLAVSNRVENLEGLNIKKVTTGLADTVQDAWQLVDAAGKAYGVTIQTYKDRSVESVSLDGQNLKITYNLANGTQSTVSVPLSSFVTESEFNSKTGLSVSSGIVSIKLSTATTSSKYLSFDTNGNLQVTGIDGKLLGTGNVMPDNLCDGAVTTAKIADSSITSDKIVLGAVVTDSIATGAVTNSKIGAGAVTEAKLAADAVTTAKIKDYSITLAKLAGEVIDSNLIEEGAAAEAAAVGAELNNILDQIGSIDLLNTTVKTNIVAAINSLVTYDTNLNAQVVNLSTALTRAVEKIATLEGKVSALEGTNFIVAKDETA